MRQSTPRSRSPSKSKQNAKLNAPAGIANKVSLGVQKIAKAGMHRRAFLRKTSAAAIALVGVSAGVADLVMTWHEQNKRQQENLLADELSKLSALLGAGTTKSVSLVAAANHPYKEPPPGWDYYPTEAECVVKYKARFWPTVSLNIVLDHPDDYSEIRHEDTLVLFGSQVANLKTRSILGSPFLDDPVDVVLGELNDWCTKLWWNLHTPDSAPETRRRQFGDEWITRNGTFVGFNIDSYTPRMEGERLTEDYLLTTVIPRYKMGPQRVVIFGAAHGPGSQAGGLLLNKPPMKELEKLVSKTGGAPYYQALWHVKIFRAPTGELLPVELTLVEAKPLRISRVDIAS